MTMRTPAQRAHRRNIADASSGYRCDDCMIGTHATCARTQTPQTEAPEAPGIVFQTCTCPCDAEQVAA